MYRRPLPNFKYRFPIALLFFIVASSNAAAQKLSTLPYVPTPQVVVDEMLRIAKVTASDYIVDLGSGDGRIVITAAKALHARGFGVDIEPKLVALANQLAKAAGVADKVDFHQRDMFKTDIAKASVVALYVLPDFMQKLRSKVLNEVKPGTRIVAHDYDMGEWLPDDRRVLTVPEKIEANGTDKAFVYLWIVPSRVAGTWRVETPAYAKNHALTLSLQQNFQQIDASATRNGVPEHIDLVTLNGDEVNFRHNAGTNFYQFKGKVSGDRIVGTVDLPSGKSFSWTGTRTHSGGAWKHD